MAAVNPHLVTALIPDVCRSPSQAPAGWTPQPGKQIHRLLLRRFRVRKRRRMATTTATTTFAGSGCQCPFLAGELQRRPSVCPSAQTAPTSPVLPDRSEPSQTHPPGRAPSAACLSIHPPVCPDNSTPDPTVYRRANGCAGSWRRWWHSGLAVPRWKELSIIPSNPRGISLRVRVTWREKNPALTLIEAKKPNLLLILSPRQAIINVSLLFRKFWTRLTQDTWSLHKLQRVIYGLASGDRSEVIQRCHFLLPFHSVPQSAFTRRETHGPSGTCQAGKSPFSFDRD